MSEELKKAIELLAQRITEKVPADEALKLSQAALNLAHTAAKLCNEVH